MMTQALNQFSKWFLHHQTFAGYVEPIMQVFKPAWRAGQFRAQVVSVKALTGRFLSVLIKPTDNWPVHVAGQHVSLTVEINGRLLTRVFTVASSPQDLEKFGTLRLLIKTNEQGRFTGLIDGQLKQGVWCNISAPSGDFVFNSLDVSAKFDTPVMFIAGGSGITPILAMLTQHLTASSNQTFTLIYYAKKSEHQCVDELDQLAAQFNNFSFFLLSREQESDITSKITLEPKPDIYCCGPSSFMKVIEAFSNTNGLRYYQEQFGLSIPQSNTNSQSDTFFNAVLNGEAHEVSANDVLLPQFEAKQLPVKRGCGIGICHQCQCIKTSGVVRNLKTGELSDNGEQLIQLCISQPVSNLELHL
ncbi:iron-sulfur cluster-binding domain-containing protein [uncultured Psychrosphaera sp.]|uniref:flavin reductase family protein n=1 Tax=uncultured Psychrosphaera sp. TaxID=1403522 RepID=UPI0030FCEFC7